MTTPTLAETLTAIAIDTYSLTGDTARLNRLSSIEANTTTVLAAAVQHYWATLADNPPDDDGARQQAAIDRLRDGGALSDAAHVFGGRAKALAAIDEIEGSTRGALMSYIGPPCPTPEGERGAVILLQEQLNHSRQMVAWARCAARLSGQRPAVFDVIEQIAVEAGLASDTVTIAAMTDGLPAWLKAAGKSVDDGMARFFNAMVPHLGIADRVSLSLSRRATYALARFGEAIALARAAVMAAEPAPFVLPAMSRDGEPLRVDPPSALEADVDAAADSEESADL